MHLSNISSFWRRAALIHAALFIKSLCEVVKGACTIIVYNQGFESSRLDDLAQWLAEYRPEIDEIKRKLWDLLATLRRNVYHPAFGGSFSLKKVAAVLLADLSYEKLAVADGAQAGLAWVKLTDPGTTDEDKKRLKQGLMEYCGMDTLALAKLLSVLPLCPALGTTREHDVRQKPVP